MPIKRNFAYDWMVDMRIEVKWCLFSSVAENQNYGNTNKFSLMRGYYHLWVSRLWLIVCGRLWCFLTAIWINMKCIIVDEKRILVPFVGQDKIAKGTQTKSRRKYKVLTVDLANGCDESNAMIKICDIGETAHTIAQWCKTGPFHNVTLAV